jgi:exodeoxyribonuclease V alpha subunit
MNGDIGIVTKVNNSERSLNAEFNGVVREWRGAALNDLAPAFAITVHKAQGSEYPCVILALFMEHFVMLQRHLLYTAMSRARGHLIVVGQEEAIRCAVRDARTNLRHGLLAARLKGASVHTLSASEARSALSVS